MDSRKLHYAVCGAVVAALTACGGGAADSSGSAVGSGSGVTTVQTASVPMIISDAASQDWAMIGVKVLSIVLIPQGGGANVTVYTAPNPAPFINLVQLDQLGELLGNASVPA